jgi:hypothetical protein
MDVEGPVSYDSSPETECQEVPALTTIMACKEATGYWTRNIVYDWSVVKTILPSDAVMLSNDGHQASAQIAPGGAVTLNFQIVAERMASSGPT